MPTSTKTAGSAGGAGPYVTGAARLKRQVRVTGLRRGARAGPLAKGLPVGCATHAPLWGLASPWRLPLILPFLHWWAYVGMGGEKSALYKAFRSIHYRPI